MHVYGSTQVYLVEVIDTLKVAQATARVWELRGFEVLSVAAGPATGHPGHSYIITMRASSTLYVNWLANDRQYQAGPYDGQESAEQAVREIAQRYGVCVGGVKDIYVTAQRDHERTYMGDPINGQ